MQVLVILLIGAFLVGGTSLGRRLREQPFLLVPLCTLAAASYYSFRVVL
jgi:hypothetical protein